jgi:hypothetical protein
VRKHGVERLVAIEQRDIFELGLSRGPTVVTLYRKRPANCILIAGEAIVGACEPTRRTTCPPLDYDLRREA